MKSKVFSKDPLASQIFETLQKTIESLGPCETRAGKGQVAFRKSRNFAIAWRPGQYLRGPCAPLVLTLTLPRKIRSARWKQVAEPVPGRFSHHLEVWSKRDLDSQVKQWLRISRRMAS